MSLLDAALERALAERLGAGVIGVSPLAGGDINAAFELELAGGRRVFMKTNRNAAEGMFEAEARGLGWLAEARAIKVPEVVAVSGDVGPSFLVLELLEPAPRRKGFDEELGRSLAALHRATPDRFGLDHANFIGNLPQSNATHARWSEFLRSERLEPQLERARRQGRSSRAIEHGFERLFARLEALVGPEEPPARLHGDLWGGNLHVDAGGAPCLIDPAVYGGHREMDLAMMRLFGGFSERVFAAYAEAFPLAPGHAERVPLCQLYPFMVHVNLFGGGYATSVERVLERYV